TPSRTPPSTAAGKAAWAPLTTHTLVSRRYALRSLCPLGLSHWLVRCVANVDAPAFSAPVFTAAAEDASASNTPRASGKLALPVEARSFNAAVAASSAILVLSLHDALPICTPSRTPPSTAAGNAAWAPLTTQTLVS